MLFSAEDFQVLITPMVWTEHKPVTAEDEAGKQAVEANGGDGEEVRGAQDDNASAEDVSKDVVAEAEAVVDKAVKKAKSAKTEKSKNGSKPSVKQREAVAHKGTS